MWKGNRGCQCSALSPFLFAADLDKFTQSIQGDMSLCMLANDIVLVDETRIGVNATLE